MLVWRIENEKGIGPYIGLSKSVDPYGSRGRHPSPEEDIKDWRDIVDNHIEADELNTSDDFYFGFSSVEKLKKWFDERTILKLYEDGYHICVFDVEQPWVWEGSRQVAFIKKNATLIFKHRKSKHFTGNVSTIKIETIYDRLNRMMAPKNGMLADSLPGSY